jgi:protein pelota
MQIMKRNLKQGEVSLRVDSLEDLWYLSQLIAAGDLVSGRTERKIKIGEGNDSKQAVVKKTVFISLNAERVEFHKYSDVLRVSGKVVEGPEDVPHGSYHTLSVEPGVSITIKKEEWLGFQLDKLKEAEAGIRSKIILVVFDREEAIFAILKGQGHEILSRLKGEVAKKRFDSGEKKSFYSEISKVLEEYNKRYSPDSIIVASPSFWKEYLMKEVPDSLKKKITLASCSDVDDSAISEVLKRPEVAKVLESDRAAKELSLLDELLRAIAKEEACYGLKECTKQVNNGAVRELLVAFSFMNKLMTEGRSREIDLLLKLCEKRGGKVHVLSSEAAEKKLLGLGGIGGVLRWVSGK